jgi:hypothetical protein
VDCPHDGDYWSCPPCQRGDEPYRGTTITQEYGASTTARFDGHCFYCREVIRKGERIELAENGWRHVGC